MTTPSFGTDRSAVPHLSRLALERIAAGDLMNLPSGTTHHVERCSACRERLTTLVAHHARWLASTDVPARVDAVLRVAAPTRRRQTWIASCAGALAAACAVVVVAHRQGDLAVVPSRADIDDGVRRKGEDLFVVYRRTPAGQVDPVSDGDDLRPGDAIRFRVTLASDGYVAVLGIDAARAVTVYAPDGPALEWIASHAPTLLDGSIILDDTLGPERIVMVACPTPRPAAALIAGSGASLARVGGDPRRVTRLTEDCREAAVVIAKVRR